MAFVLSEWAEANELAPETITALGEKGFSTFKSITKLTVEIIRKEFTKPLNPGQLLLLLDAVDSLKTREESTTERDAGESRDELLAKLNQLLPNPVASTSKGSRHIDHNMPGPSAHAQRGEEAENMAASMNNNNNQGNRTATSEMQSKLNDGQLGLADIMALLRPNNETPNSSESPSKITPQAKTSSVFDPLAFDLNMLSPKPVKFRDIRDFISKSGYKREERESVDSLGTVKVGSTELSLKDSRMPLEKIRFTQYIEASLMILRAMVLEDKADMTTVLEYVAYIIKMSRLAQSFRWESLLRYDVEYRKAQAETGFRWGADSPYLFQLYLQSFTGDPSKKTQGPNNQRHQQRNTPQHQRTYSNKFDPATGKIICRKFNSITGCELRGCKFRHVCLSCNGEHTDCSRGTTDPAQPR